MTAQDRAIDRVPDRPYITNHPFDLTDAVVAIRVVDREVVHPVMAASRDHTPDLYLQPITLRNRQLNQKNALATRVVDPELRGVVPGRIARDLDPHTHVHLLMTNRLILIHALGQTLEHLHQ